MKRILPWLLVLAALLLIVAGSAFAQPAGSVFSLAPLRGADAAGLATVTTLVAVQDATINSGLSRVPGDATYMKAGSAFLMGDERALVQFDLSSVPSASFIQSAILSAYWDLCAGSCAPMTATIHRLTQSWDESTAVWGTIAWASDPQAYVTATLVAADIRTRAQWDVTALVREWVAGDYPNDGLAIHGTEGQPFNDRYFSTHERGAGWGAQLQITWFPVTATPTLTPTVTPTGGVPATSTPTATRTNTATPTRPLLRGIFLPVILN